MQFRCDDFPPTDDKDDSEIEDKKLTRALIEFRQPNSEINIIEETQDSTYEKETQQSNGLLDETAFLYVIVAKEGELVYIPLSIALGLNTKDGRKLPYGFWRTNHRWTHRHQGHIKRDSRG